MDKISITEAISKVSDFIVNGSILYDKKNVNLRHISKANIEIKECNGTIYVKVYNLECNPYPWFLINRGLLVHNSQGQLTESANKFLNEAEKWGLKVYCVHDADCYGIQMQLLYGLASKNNCYMPSEFYPQNTESLGFFPSIAQILGLPPETVGEEIRLENYLNTLLQEKPEFQEELNILMKEKKKWEFQALNAIDEKAPQIYIIEGLRAKGDEIKHVPEGEELKQQVIREAQNRINQVIENGIYAAVNKALEEAKEEVEGSIRDSIKDKIEQFTQLTRERIESLEKVPAINFREAVKKELVNNPSQYWEDALRRVINASFNLEFNIDTEVDILTDVKKVETTQDIKVSLPLTQESFTKNDIVAAIEEKIIRKDKERDKIVNPIRDAFEQVFGKPDLTW